MAAMTSSLETLDLGHINHKDNATTTVVEATAHKANGEGRP